MAKGVVIYDLATKELLSVHQVSNDAHVSVFPAQPATEGAIVVPITHSVVTEQARWRIQAGALVQKATVVITPNKTAITADGVDEATLDFVGLVADATVSFGLGLLRTVTVADPQIILTSDVPQVFEIQMADALHWSNPVLVEAA